MKGALRHIIVVLILFGVSPLYAVKNITIYSTPDKDETTQLFSNDKKIELYL